jgi:hypothetical protein
MEPEGRPDPIANFHSFTRLPKLTLLPFPPYRRAVKSIFEEYVSHFRYSRSYTLFRSFQLISLSISSQTARLPIPTSLSKHCFSHLLSYFLCNHSRKIPHSRRITQAAFPTRERMTAITVSKAFRSYLARAARDSRRQFYTCSHVTIRCSLPAADEMSLSKSSISFYSHFCSSLRFEFYFGSNEYDYVYREKFGGKRCFRCDAKFRLRRIRSPSSFGFLLCLRTKSNLVL